MNWLVTRVATRLRRTLGCLGPADSGTAAVEFGMIAPVMVILFLGCVELSQALTVSRRLEKASSSTVDLFTRPQAGDSLTTAEADGHFLIVNEILKPYDASQLTIKIVSVKAKAGGGNLVSWSRDNKGGTPYAAGGAYSGSLPAIALADGESVMIAESSYKFTPIVFLEFLPASFEFTDTHFMKPRNAFCISLLPAKC